MASLSILETSLYASDLKAAERFYGDVLGLALDPREIGRHVFFRCGDAMLLVFDPSTTSVKADEVPTHGARGPGHIAFAVADSDFDSYLTTLAEHEVEIEASIGRPTGGRSIYFRDPAGNSLELTTPSGDRAAHLAASALVTVRAPESLDAAHDSWTGVHRGFASRRGRAAGEDGQSPTGVRSAYSRHRGLWTKKLGVERREPRARRPISVVRNETSSSSAANRRPVIPNRPAP